RAPISACPVFSRIYDRRAVLMPFATWPAHPMYWRFTPAVASPAFSCPVSSIATITSPPRRFPRRAASVSPATANRRTTLIAAEVSQLAWLSSRWVLSGVLSPACRAMLHPLRSGSSLITAAVYLPACSHGSGLAKHGRRRSSSSARFRSASPAPDRKLPHLEGSNQLPSSARL